MSSRSDHRRRQRSWERDDRDRDHDRHFRGDRRSGGTRGRHDEGRRRSSRSRSPRNRERHGGPDRRDHRRDWEDDRRDRGERDRRDRRDSKDTRRKDDGREHGIHREDRKSTPRKEDTTKQLREEDGSHNRPAATPVFSASMSEHNNETDGPGGTPSKSQSQPSTRPNLDPDASDEGDEEGEEMDVVNHDDAAVMVMMGLTGFGSTKGKQVEGNQEGAVHVKKVRTWRQYMNRRGGFNRPLDKIK
ncbi:DUF1777-domain-containing protein [Tricholoma matsutake]|nr:DUF1777-domain-containing protein [Tricholoma matsutake 945]